MGKFARLSSPGGYSGKPRLVGVDLLRILAMLSMVEGHTLDVLLQAQYQTAQWHNVWEFVRGFTAPVFLTLSGFSFAVVTVRGWDKHLTFSPAVRRRLRRFCFFIFLGYLMHFPVQSIGDLQYMTAERWLSGLQVDVLQAIGVTLLGLEALVWLSETPKRFARWSLVLSALVILATPLVWTAHWASALPFGVSAYLHGQSGSLFPLFPWSGYVLLGAALGALYEMKDRISPLPFARVLIGIGAVGAVLGYQLQAHGFTLYPHDTTFWNTSPNLFVMRAGTVLYLLGVGLHLRRVPARAARAAAMLASESLLVYFFHVCLLYGSVWNPGLRRYWGGSFDLVHSAEMAAVMIVLSFGMAVAWRISRNVGVWSTLGHRLLAMLRLRRWGAEPAGD